MKKLITLILTGTLLYSCGEVYGELPLEFKNAEKLIVKTQKDTVTTTKNELITEFTSLLESGYKIKPHKCMINFEIDMVNSNNDKMTFYMTKGHSKKHYEFSLNGGAYQIDIVKFNHIIESLNLNLSKL